jgi:hypothetical protein
MNEIERALREDAEAERAGWRRHMRRQPEPAVAAGTPPQPDGLPVRPDAVLTPIARAVRAIAARCHLRRDGDS